MQPILEVDTIIEVSRSEQEFIDIILETKDPSCQGFKNGEIKFVERVGGYGELMFSINGGPFTGKDNYPFLDQGAYTIVAKDSLGCEVIKEIIINPPTEIEFNLGDDRVVQLGESTDISIVTNVPPDSVDQIIWSDTTALVCTKCLFQTIQPPRTTLYQVELIDINGCSAYDELLISVIDNFKLELPNVINPSSSNGNDVFFIDQTQGIVQVNFLSIFDRWGNRMYHAENFTPGDQDFGWNGIFNGEPVLPGVYPYVVELILENGETILHHSDITIVR